MKKFKVWWYEDTTEKWEAIIEAENLEAIKKIVDNREAEMFDKENQLQSQLKFYIDRELNHAFLLSIQIHMFLKVTNI